MKRQKAAPKRWRVSLARKSLTGDGSHFPADSPENQEALTLGQGRVGDGLSASMKPEREGANGDTAARARVVAA